MDTIPKVPTREELAEQGRRNREERVKNYPAVETATLRDLFAAFALAGILAQPNGNPLGNPHDVGLRWCAATAYDLADAMLAQRTKKD